METWKIALLALAIAAVLIVVIFFVVRLIMKPSKKKSGNDPPEMFSPYNVEQFFRSNDSKVFDSFVQSYIKGESGSW